MYHHSPNLVLGFHGCTKNTFEQVLYHHQELEPSNNTYDWLGNGIYFWENSYDRAIDWALSHYKNEDAAVIGTVLDLGFCLDLMDFSSREVLKAGYDILVEECKQFCVQLPVNKNIGKKFILILDFMKKHIFRFVSEIRIVLKDILLLKENIRILN